jgi:hypothetical protein
MNVEFFQGTEYMLKSVVWNTFKGVIRSSWGSSVFSIFIIFAIEILQILTKSCQDSDNWVMTIIGCVARCLLSIIGCIFKFIILYVLIYSEFLEFHCGKVVKIHWIRCKRICYSVT